MNTKKLLILSLALLFVCPELTRTWAAPTLALGDNGIEVDNGADAKYVLGYPVLVNSAKKDIKIQEKTVSGKTAVLKFEGGGQIDVALEEGKVALKLSQVPAGSQFIGLNMKVGIDIANGGKWNTGGGETAFPATKGAPNIFQGNSKNLVLISPTGTKTSFVVPDHTYEQIQDGREWNLSNFLWKAWAPILPGVDSYSILIGNSDIVSTPKPAAAPTAVATLAPSAPAPAAKPGDNPSDTIVLKWKDGKKTVFYLAFDDSCPTDIRNAIPELTKRNIPGTFYVVAGGPVHNNLKDQWLKAVENPLVVLANHTLNHNGVQNAEELDSEISKCNDLINAYYPGRKTPRLISFGQPGGVPWKVTKEEFQAVLDKYHLINRPSFYGPPFHQKSQEEVLAVVDLALKNGELGHLDFHGVGGDWHITPLEWFTALLDKLDANRGQIWLTDPISWHQYQTERKTAVAKVLKSEPREIKVQLSSQADPAFYDFPLTLATRVPADWKGCSITQGTAQSKAAVVDGVVKYEALPGATEIVLQPTDAP